MTARLAGAQPIARQPISSESARVANGRTVRLVRSFTFEAAHLLPHLPTGHKCARLHGHSFKVEVVCEGCVDQESGWLIDFADIRECMNPLLEQLDHHYLNEVPGLENPTSENIACWIWEKLEPALPILRRIIVAETCNARCEYEGLAG